MITKVHKYLIFGAREDLDSFYARAQVAGCIEFIQKEKMPEHLPEEVVTLMGVVKILKKLPPKEKLDEEWTLEEALAFAKRISSLKEQIDRLHEEKRLLVFDQARIAPFGHFSTQDIAYLEKEGKRRVQFFSRSANRKNPIPVDEDLLYVSTENGLEYFISIAKTHKTYPGLIEMRLEQSLDELASRLEKNLAATQVLSQELREGAGALECIQAVLLQQLDIYDLETAKKKVRIPFKSGSVFSVEAWVPDSKKETLKALTEDLAIAVSEIKVEAEDREPTYMENTGFKKIGEDLVAIYDVPSITDKDPSGWIFWCFALFFAMIMSDAGYGLIFLMFAGYLRWKCGLFTGKAKRLYRLFVVLSCFTVGWGLMTSSFFGIEVSHDNIFRKYSPLQLLVDAKANYHVQSKDDVYEEWKARYPEVAQATTGEELIVLTTPKPPAKPISPVVSEFSNNILLEFSLLVGTIHIGISLLRYARRKLSNIGWFIFLVGGYLFFPSMLRATTMLFFLRIIDPKVATAFGLQCIYVGIGVAILFALMQKGLSGLKEIMDVVQVFGDVLSYVRLYALALASIIMASTFNEMGAGVGLLGGLVVIVAGHAATMSLGAMSGVIHGLRLNFIEWYHFSFEGGGKAFNPLRLLKTKKD